MSDDSEFSLNDNSTYKQRSKHGKIMLETFLRPIEEYLARGNIQEIMINGPDDIWIEEDGILKSLQGVKLNEQMILGAIKTLGSLDGRDVLAGNGLSIVDTRLEKLRIAAAIKPTAVLGPMISIRKQSPIIKTIDDYTGIDTINDSKLLKKEDIEIESINKPEDINGFLRFIIKEHKNIILAGGTSSGKTTFLKALLQIIDKNDRTVVIEDTSEIASNFEILPPNRVCLESNTQIGISTRDLVRLSLRMRPDRIIVGEIRGAEAFDLMQALNTGHDGGITSLHANSAIEALSRLETMVLTSDVQWPFQAIKSQIARTFHYVVFMTRSNGKRGISEILKINGYDGENYITKYLWPKI